jgi:hypothetical protein
MSAPVTNKENSTFSIRESFLSLMTASASLVCCKTSSLPSISSGVFVAKSRRSSFVSAIFWRSRLFNISRKPFSLVYEPSRPFKPILISGKLYPACIETRAKQKDRNYWNIDSSGAVPIRFWVKGPCSIHNLRYVLA